MIRKWDKVKINGREMYQLLNEIAKNQSVQALENRFIWQRIFSISDEEFEVMQKDAEKAVERMIHQKHMEDIQKCFVVDEEKRHSVFDHFSDLKRKSLMGKNYSEGEQNG